MLSTRDFVELMTTMTSGKRIQQQSRINTAWRPAARQGMRRAGRVVDCSCPSSRERGAVISAELKLTLTLLHAALDPQAQQNAGAVMDRGLWAWTRHPNYFGDACVWFGLWLLALGHPMGLLTVVSPVAMTYFLVNVTGKALLEKGMRRSRGAAYDDYVARTSGFFPRPPRRR